MINCKILLVYNLSKPAHNISACFALKSFLLYLVTKPLENLWSNYENVCTAEFRDQRIIGTVEELPGLTQQSARLLKILWESDYSFHFFALLRCCTKDLKKKKKGKKKYYENQIIPLISLPFCLGCTKDSKRTAKKKEKKRKKKARIDFHLELEPKYGKSNIVIRLRVTPSLYKRTYRKCRPNKTKHRTFSRKRISSSQTWTWQWQHYVSRQVTSSDKYGCTMPLLAQTAGQ